MGKNIVPSSADANLTEQADGIVGRMINRTKQGICDLGIEAVTLAGNALETGAKTTGYIAGKAVRSGIGAVNEAAKGVFGKEYQEPWMGSKA